MKKLVFFLLNAFLMNLDVRAQEITLAADPWCPYICDINSDKPGILVEATSLILKSTDYKVNFLTINWARSIKDVRSGKVNGVISAYKSDAPDFLYQEPAFLISEMCFFIPKHNEWLYTGISSLESRFIVFMNGYSYGYLFDNYILNNENSGNKNLIRITGLDAEKRRLTLVEKQRVNTIIEDKLVFTYLIKSTKFNTLYKEAGCLDGEGVYIGFSPNLESSLNYAKVISIGLKKLIESGEMQKIIDKYTH